MEITTYLRCILARVIMDEYDELSQDDKDLYYTWELQSLELIGDLDLFWMN
ncbi:MAG TPA: hypothetical protein VJ951_00940 [Bacteroidales bacterium]|nr:hypothetical protein [Bacteroidales bacterium]